MKKICQICLRDLEHAADAMFVHQTDQWICPKTSWIECARIEEEGSAARARRAA